MNDPRWDNLTNSEWNAFATAWTAELNGDQTAALPDLPWLLDGPSPTTAGEYVVPMNFTASSSAQWKFIQAAYWCGNKESHGHLAAGPIEHLLGKHGAEYIVLVEQLADDDPLFANILMGCYQNQMSDDVWQRLCVARENVG